MNKTVHKTVKHIISKIITVNNYISTSAEDKPSNSLIISNNRANIHNYETKEWGR